MTDSDVALAATTADRPLYLRLERSLGAIAGRTVSAVLEELTPYRNVPPEAHGELAGFAFAGLQLFARCLRADRLPTTGELAGLGALTTLPSDDLTPRAMLSAHHVAARVMLEELARLASCDEQGDVIRAALFVQRFLPELIPVVGSLAELQAGHGAERQLRHALAQALLAGEPATAVADQAGIPLAPGYVVATVRARRDDVAPERWDIASATTRRIHQTADRVVGAPVAAALDDDALGGTLLLPVFDGDVRAVVDLLPDLVGGFEAALGGPVDIAIAVAPTRGETPAAHDQATEVLRLARALGRPAGLHRLEDMLVEYQLSRPSTALPALEHLLDSLDGNPDLRQTVRTYLSMNLNRQATAAALHIHPNTLDYRLRRIAELTGLDPTTGRGLQLLAATLITRAARERG